VVQFYCSDINFTTASWPFAEFSEFTNCGCETGKLVSVDYIDFEILEHERQVLIQDISLDRLHWQQIEKARSDFLLQGIDCPADVVKPQIFESWKRSRDLGIDPDTAQLCIQLSDQEYQRVAGKNTDLIGIAQPLLHIIEDLHLENDYIFELIETSGATLTRIGKLDLHRYIAEKSIFNESTMGTNAHSLCMRHKTAVQLMGPEHYCRALHGLAACSAPILDEHGEVVASLLLTQPLPQNPWSETYQNLMSHTLGLITSLASAIEYQMKFQRCVSILEHADRQLGITDSSLNHTRNLFEATVANSDECVIILDSKGIVQQASPETAYLLKTVPDELVGQPVWELLDLIWPTDIEKILESDAKMPLVFGSDTYEVQPRLIISSGSGELEGVILKLRRPEQDHAYQQPHDSGDVVNLTFDDILGPSDAIKSAIKLAKRYATTNENILLVGESGTGKEYFAQAIHNASRPNGPFMSINCAAIPSRLIESELFGYEDGSFTGAKRGGKPGKIEMAQGGTLFLDEIGDMPLDLQATLLRVLENKRVMRLGGKRYQQVNFRIMAATNRDLLEMVREKAFREDLFYRLSILTVHLPSLEERPADKLFFARYYLNECRCKDPNGPQDFAPETRRLIETYRWPGNVRQLKNVVFSSYFAARSGLIQRADLPPYVQASKKSEGAQASTTNSAMRLAPALPDERVDESSSSKLLTLKEQERTVIDQALAQTNNNVAKAAELLGISKATLYRRLK
jgi:transcriptional regulator with PAS, ATPase and Fis domain